MLPPPPDVDISPALSIMCPPVVLVVPVPTAKVMFPPAPDVAYPVEIFTAPD